MAAPDIVGGSLKMNIILALTAALRRAAGSAITAEAAERISTETAIAAKRAVIIVPSPAAIAAGR